MGIMKRLIEEQLYGKVEVPKRPPLSIAKTLLEVLEARPLKSGESKREREDLLQHLKNQDPLGLNWV